MIHQSTGRVWFALSLFANNVDIGINPVFNDGDQITEFKGVPHTNADILNQYGHIIHNHIFPAYHTLPQILKHLIWDVQITNNQHWNNGT